MNDKQFFERLLGGMSIERFLREYWQRKPLHVKNAFDPALLGIAPQEIFSLAANDEVESRMVKRKGERWSLDRGPFPSVPTAKRDWTVLVQGVNLHDARADALMDRFRFLPHARLDDVMISYAVGGGGVGPHFDSYDVFLLQSMGTRHWRISRQRDLTLIPDFPLKILADFRPDAEFLCEPGDLLYLPPQCAHDGVARGTCMTWSVGFRTPPHAEMLREYLMFSADQVDLPGRYADPGLLKPKHPAQVPTAMVDMLDTLVQRHRFERDEMAEFIGCFLSEPKSTTVFEHPAPALSRARFDKLVAQTGLAVHRRAQLLHDRRRIYINGEALIATAAEGRVLRKLADRRCLSAAGYAQAPKDVRELLYGWYTDGWIIPIDTQE